MKPLRWLLDSNAVMGYLNADSSAGFLERMEACFVEGSAISVITWIEVLGWRGHSERSRADALQLLGCFERINLDEAVVDRSVALRTELPIKLPDAVIAASAITAGLTLVTRNVRDFARVNGLGVLDPYARGTADPS